MMTKKLRQRCLEPISVSIVTAVKMSLKAKLLSNDCNTGITENRYFVLSFDFVKPIIAKVLLAINNKYLYFKGF